MRIENLILVIEKEGRGGGFEPLKALHRNNLHFTERFLTGEALQGRYMALQRRNKCCIGLSETEDCHPAIRDRLGLTVHG